MNLIQDRISALGVSIKIEFRVNAAGDLVSLSARENLPFDDLIDLRLGRAILFVCDALFGAAKAGISTQAIFERIPNTPEWAIEKVLLAKIGIWQCRYLGDNGATRFGDAA